LSKKMFSGFASRCTMPWWRLQARQGYGYWETGNASPDGIRSPEQGPPVSICIYCGQDHDASLRVCPKTGRAIGAPAPAAQKTLFGVAASFAPPVPEPAKSGPTVTLPSPRPMPPSNQSSALALGKTVFGVAPPPLKLPPPGASPLRLPTEAEVRDNPDLVISLEVTPPPSANGEASARTSEAAPDTLGTGTPVDLPDLDMPTNASDDDDRAATEGPPMDLPPPGKGKPFALPQPADGAASGEARRARSGNFAERLTADARSVLDLFQWATGAYLRKPAPFFMLAAMLVLPASVLQSCLLAGVARGPDASALAQRGRDGRFLGAQGRFGGAHSGQPGQRRNRQAGGGRVGRADRGRDHTGASARGQTRRGWRLDARETGAAHPGAAALWTGVSHGLRSAGHRDRRQAGGAALPGIGDIWPILLGRGELFLVSLVPAALLVAVGTRSSSCQASY
jgi:hypothetical protein